MEAEAGPGDPRAQSVEQCVRLRPVEPGGEEAHHLRVGMDEVEEGAVALLPIA